ncbi:hypothetical protein WICPIJ_008680 [Wickerhamomyces pijperi]|uniref:Regulator of free ubiquitin chains 1 n=1 Tax=Wickerhamomyces pijperi TaxID=599730 RepID=A0A9P8PVR6_WICPI|nr:hypothetical protein WICPIJ_008680 [Wickerhamomyces pijperi]
MPVPMDSDGTYSIKQLVEEAHEYEYSPTVPLKIYLTTANRLKANANLFKEQDHYADAYKLYIRFLDLLTNKIATHPQLSKKHPVEYKRYLMLVKQASDVFQSAEDVKVILSEKIDRYQRLTKKLADQRAKEAHEKLMRAADELKKKRQEEEAKEEQKRVEENANHRSLSDNESVISDISVQATELPIGSDSAESSSKFQGLRRKFSDSLFNHNAAHSTPHLEVVESYPTIPKFHVPAQKHNLVSEIEGPPPVPPPKISSEPPSNIPPLTPMRQSIVPAYSSSSGKILGPSSVTEHSHAGSTSQRQHSPPTTSIQHKPIAVNEAGKTLKKTFIPLELKSQFLEIASSNTKRKLETCGILCGKLSLNAFFVTTLLIPKQESTENTCQTVDEELMFDYIDKNDLFVLGWIHTHPTQSCFLSSVDLHTQNAYQLMLPEAVAIVCAPSIRHDVGSGDFGVFRLTDPPGVGVITKCQRSGFHPHNEGNLYKSCERRNKGHVVFESGLPFIKHDLR